MDFFLKARFLIPVASWLIVAILLYSYLKYFKKKELTSDYLQRRDTVIIKWYYRYLPHPLWLSLVTLYVTLFLISFLGSSEYDKSCHDFFRFITLYRIGYFEETYFTEQYSLLIILLQPYLFLAICFSFIEKIIYELIFIIAPKFSDYKFNKDLGTPKESNGLKRNLFPLLFGFFIIVASVRAPEFWFLYLILCFFLGYVLWWGSKVHLVKDKLIRHRVRAIRNFFKLWCLLLFSFLSAFYVPIYRFSEKGIEIADILSTESLPWSEVKSLELNFSESSFGLEDGEKPTIEHISSGIALITTKDRIGVELFHHIDSEKKLINFLKEKGIPVICNVSPLARELLVKEIPKELFGRDKYIAEAKVGRLKFCS